MPERWVIWRKKKCIPRGVYYSNLVSREEALAAKILQDIQPDFDSTLDPQMFCGYGGGDRPTLWTYVTTDTRIKSYASVDDAKKYIEGVLCRDRMKGYNHDYGVDMHPEDRYHD
jgi:hypothetical protein